MKNKKDKQKKQEIILGEKIKEIKTNTKYNKHIHIAFLILFNALLITSLIFFVCYITNWLTITVSILLFIYSITHSIFTYIKIDKNHKYIIYENYLYIETLFFNAHVDLKTVLNVKPCKTWLEKLFKLNTTSLKVTFNRTLKHSVNICYIEEDLNEIIKTILNTASTAKSTEKN